MSVERDLARPRVRPLHRGPAAVARARAHAWGPGARRRRRHRARRARPRAPGSRVTALDRDPELLAELAQRAQAAGLDVPTVLADAREFELDERFALCIVPMQTIQLLGGAAGRAAFLRRARRHLRRRRPAWRSRSPRSSSCTSRCAGVAAAAAGHLRARRRRVLEPADRRSGNDDGGFVLERRREIVDAHGERTVQDDAVRLDRLRADAARARGRRRSACAPSERLMRPADRRSTSAARW